MELVSWPKSPESKKVNASSITLEIAYTYLINYLLFQLLAYLLVGLGGLGLTFSPRDPRFAGSNSAEVDESSGRDLSCGSRVYFRLIKEPQA